MSIAPTLAVTIRAQVEALLHAPQFERLLSGATREEYDRFLRSVARVHLLSPRYLAFLYALAPPVAETALEHNLLEELGRERADEPSHPELLRALLRAAGMSGEIDRIAAEAIEELCRTVSRPLPLPTLRDFAFSALCEVVAAEFLLARMSSPIASALARHCGLADVDLAWFLHHSEVDVGHAEQGLAAIDAFVAHYRMDDATVGRIVAATFRENVFLRRYFAP